MHFPARIVRHRPSARDARILVVASLLAPLGALAPAAAAPRAASVQAATVAAGKYSLSASPSSVSLQPGGSVTVTITAARGKGFTSSIYLAVSGVPRGITVKPATNPMTTRKSTTTVRITAAATMTAKTFTLAVNGSSKGKTARANVKVTVGSIALPTTPATTAVLSPTTTIAAGTPTTTLPSATTTTFVMSDYSLAVDPQSVTVPAGAAATATLKITRTGGFKEDLFPVLEGIPSGISGTVDAVVGTAPSSTIRLNAAAGMAPGSYDVTVRARGRLATFKVVVSSSVTLAANPTSFTITRGSSANVGLTLSQTPTSAVTWATDPLPVGVTATFNPNGSALVGTTLTLSTTAASAPGTYAVVVSATAGTAKVTTVISVTLSAAATSPMGVAPNPATLIVGQRVVLTMSPPAIPAGTLPALGSRDFPAGVTLDPSSFLQSGTQYTISAVAASTAVPGTYSPTLILHVGTTQYATTFTLVVATSAATTQSLTLAASNASLRPGTSVNVVITATWGAGSTPTPITYSWSGGPAGASVTFSPNPSAAGTTATITVPPTAAVGNYVFTFVGTITGGGAVGTSTVGVTA